MDFAYTDEQRMLAESVERFGREAWPAAERERRLAEPDAEAKTWARMADLGWLALPLPAAHGGLDGAAEDVMALAEALGRQLIPAPFTTSCVLAPSLLHDDDGTAPAAAELLEATAEGRSRAAAALLEARGGYALAFVETRAEPAGARWRLTGAKAHVEDGAGADAFVVSARTAGAPGDRAGVGLFLVRADATGLEVERFRAADGHAHARLMLDGVEATALGDSAGAADRLELAVDRAIAAQLAEALGSAEALNASTLEHLRTRRQFGRAIGEFQVLRHRAVDMAVAAEEARSMTYLATLSLHRPRLERRRAVSAAKARVSQVGLEIARAAVQLHGGVGVSEELIVSHHYRRQMMLDFAHGDAAHHRALYRATEAERRQL